MEAKRPGAPNVLGILSIIFGAVVTGLSIIGLAVADGSIAAMGAEAAAAMRQYMAELQPWSTIISVIMILMSVALIFIGIGQRGYRRWARSATLTWSITGIAVLIGQLAFHFVVTAPALHRLIEGMSGGMGKTLSGLSTGAGLTTLMLYLPYPIIMMVLMQRPAVVEAMKE